MNRPSRRTARDVLALACSTALAIAFGLGVTPAAHGEVVAMAASEAEAATIDPATGDPDFTKLDLEGLMNVPIYSVSKAQQTLAQAPAAATVITQDEIRRSGMDSIPELLRLVPGLDVARINASQWAISSRGFNDLYANKLLVMMDGRSVYTPLFSGVYWDTLDYIMPDLDRIEVVRGPGATLWGTNAVNGVINITTKSAKDTQGLLVTGEGSNIDAIGGVRYGGRIDDVTWYRVYGKYRTTDDFDFANGDNAHDGWDSVRGGFRIDREAGDKDTLTLQGDIYAERVGQTLNVPTVIPPAFKTTQDVTSNFSGGNVLARWSHRISETSDFTVQAYYDRLQRGDAQLGYDLNTFDLDFQHRFALTKHQEIIWGADVRFLSDSIQNVNPGIGVFDPTHRDDYLVSGFIQDDITLVPDRLHFILGTKLEDNSYSDFEIQPSARVLFTPNDRNTIWGAVSRAVRTPSRWEQDSRIVFATVPTTPAGVPGEIDTFGNRNFDSEDMIAYELGYRVQATPALSLDLSAFYNSYDNLRSGTLGTPSFTPTPAPHLLLPVALGNDIDGETYGGEVAATWKVNDMLRLVASYSFLEVQLHRGAGVDATLEHTYEGTSPRNQFQLRSYLDVTKNLEVNAALYYVDNVRTGNIPAYARVDAGVTWRPKDNLEVSVGVQNLFDNRHPEFNDGLFLTSPTEIPRTYFAQLTWRY
jgi:iron complex outermembrane recepter protein